jgi:hypothetical protein
MNLGELIARHPRKPAHQVPEWMMGLWRRHIISFADGSSDVETQVYWLQSRNFSIDLRLPRPSEVVSGESSLASRTARELEVLANYEGWVAHSHWDGAQLSWTESTSLQFEDRWPEPARLHRVGNCMIEFAPSGAYVEDWRLQPSTPGPLVGLRLIEERELPTGRVLHRGGGLIVSGQYAGLVLGRAEEAVDISPLREQVLVAQVLAAQGNQETLQRLLGFETSIAHGSLADGFTVTHSTKPGRLGAELFPLDGFLLEADGTVLQELVRGGQRSLRRFEVDTIESLNEWPLSTPQAPTVTHWMERNAATLRRHKLTLQ